MNHIVACDKDRPHPPFSNKKPILKISQATMDLTALIRARSQMR
jgi:hypothetical protein